MTDKKEGVSANASESKEAPAPSSGKQPVRSGKAIATDAVDEHSEELLANANQCVKNQQYEAALAIYVPMLQKLIPIHGEKSLVAARLYEEYGRTLLSLASKNSTVFGQQETTEAASAEEAAEDYQIAWENLETARLIYSQSPGSNRKLYRVLHELAQLGLETDQFKRAYDDFDTARKIGEQENMGARSAAGDHVDCGMAAFYMPDFKLSQTHYQKAHELIGGVLQEKVTAACKDASSNLDANRKNLNALVAGVAEAQKAEILELNDVYGELSEKLDELKEVIDRQQKEEEKKSSSSAPTSNEPIFEIGFGDQSSSSSQSAPVNVLSVKRKAPNVCTVSNGESANQGSAKKAKAEATPAPPVANMPAPKEDAAATESASSK